MKQFPNSHIFSFLICLVVVYSTEIKAQNTAADSIFKSKTITAPNNEQLIGHWGLQKVSLKKTVAVNSEKDKDLFLAVFKAALYEELTKEQKLNLEDLEWSNSKAEKLRDTYYQTVIEFKPNGAFYNTPQNQTKPLSGEYVLDKRKLLLEWETADKNNFKVLKITANELVLKDNKLKIIYTYNKLQQQKVDELSAKLKKEKELECTKPDKARIEAQKKAEERFNQTTKTK
jgi:hypothetical protein